MSLFTQRERSDRMPGGQFEDELDAVREKMSVAASELGSPLNNLVQPRVLAADPLVQAALILCVGYDGGNGPPHHRIQLAAALEMLHVALGIHQLLVDSAASNPLSQTAEDQRSFIGSTILAGDFCFSRSAQMAAKTESPKIVTIFAQALQKVSESSLRQLFSSQNGSQPSHRNERNEILLRSGATAAVELCGLDVSARPTLLELAESTIQYMLTGEPASSPCRGPLRVLPPAHQQRWQALCDWIFTSR